MNGKDWFGKFLMRSGCRHLMMLVFVSVMLSVSSWNDCSAGVPNAQNGQAGKQDAIDGNYDKAIRFKQDELLVRFKVNVDDQRKEKVHQKLGHRKIRDFSFIRVHHVKLKKGVTLAEAIAEYQAEPEVELAEPDYPTTVSAVPNDTDFPSLWGMTKIHAPEAWDLVTGTPGGATDVVVAVIDSGIDYNHPDLAANMWSGIGYNAITGSNDPMDDNGHGTHVAGTIGAVGNNGLGVAGVNWNVKLLACKAQGADGNGYVSDIIACLNYVKNMKAQGVNIVATNNSWGIVAESGTLRAAIDAQRDILFIAAANNQGNNSDLTPSYPASFDLPNIISVAATDSTEGLWDSSNYGKRTVTLGAPGVGIYSTYPNQSYFTNTGTSMATPHVAGVAALLKAQDQTRDWRAIKNLILTGGQELPSLAGKTITGRRVDAYGSVSCNNSKIFMPLELPSKLEPGVPVIFRFRSINCASPAGSVGNSKSFTVTLSDGTGTFELHDDGTGADSIDGDGIFTGTFVPGIGVTSERFVFTSLAGSLTQRLPALTIGEEVLPSGFLNYPYSYRIPVTGGLSPYGTLTLISGLLPSGLEFSAATGEITGSPTETGTYDLTFQLSDAEVTTQRTLRLVVYKGGVLEERQTPWDYPNGALASDRFGNLYAASAVSSGTNIILNKYSSAGEVLWSRSYETATVQNKLRMVVDKDDNVVIASRVGGFLLKYSRDGALVWGKQLTDYSDLEDVALDRSGNLVVFGEGGSYGAMRSDVLTLNAEGTIISSWSMGSWISSAFLAVDSGDNVLVTFHGVDGNGRQKLFLNKYTSNGVPLWSSGDSVSITSYENTGIGVDAADNVYLLGQLSFFYPSYGALIKFNSSGERLWAKYPENFYARGLAIDDSGTAITTGGLIDNSTTPAHYSMHTMAYDQNGEVAWEDSYPWDIFSWGFAPTLDSFGKLHVGAWNKNAQTGKIVTYRLLFQISSDSYPSATAGRPYSGRIYAVGGIRPYTWSLANGTLPIGLSLDPGTGTLSGIPAVTGTTLLAMQVADKSGMVTSKVVPIRVYDNPVFTPNIPTAVQNQQYIFDLNQQASGGLPPYTWSLQSGDSLPPDISLMDGYHLLGTPRTLGEWDFHLIVTDNLGATDTKPVHFRVSTPVIITTTSLKNAPKGELYSDFVTVSGGVMPYKWSVVPGSGSLPTGLILNVDTGEISQMPTVSGPFTFTARVVDAVGVSAEQQYTITAYDPLVIAGTPTPNASVNVPYSSSFNATGGTLSYTWTAVNALDLPPGLTLNPNGTLSGMPTKPGPFTFQAVVTDKIGVQTTSQPVTITVAYVPPTIVPSFPPTLDGRYPATVNQPVALRMTATGGLPPYEWYIDGPAPAGLAIDKDSGALVWTPAVVGSASFTIKVTDSYGVGTKVINYNVLGDAALKQMWSKLQVPDGTSIDSVSGTVADSASNIYLAATIINTSGYKLSYLAKLDPSGTLLWSRTYQSAANKDAWTSTVFIDKNDIVYVGGRRCGTDGNWSDFIIKYDTNGNQIIQVLATSSLIGPIAAVDESGNIIVAADYNVTKYSATWSSLFTLTLTELTKAVSIDQEGNILVGGTTSLTKLASTGSQMWKQSIGSRGVFSIKSDTSGNIYVAYEGGAPQYDLRVKKLDSSGTQIWVQATTLRISTHYGMIQWGYPGPASMTLQLTTDRVVVSAASNAWTGSDDSLLAVFSNTDGSLLGALTVDAGGNEYGRGLVIDKNDYVYMVAAGPSYSGKAALTKYYVPAAISPKIAAGQYHTLALKNDGTVLAWGNNGYGQLGDGTSANRTTPTPVSELSNVAAIAAAYSHSVAVKTDGTVVAWGDNSYGQLGDGTTTRRYFPTPVPGLTGVKAVTAGNGYTVALKRDGTVVSWGSNVRGVLGDGATTNRSVPMPVPGLTEVVAISSWQEHTLALKGDGTVVAWGSNINGQLGDGTRTDRYSPTPVTGLTGVIAVAAGQYHSMASKSDGTLLTWGYNSSGQLGNGTTSTVPTTVPAVVSGLSGVMAMAGGSEYSVALKNDGTLTSWGRNSYGQLGDGTTASHYSPLPVPGLSGVIAVAAGDSHTVALRGDASVVTWGRNTDGQVGDGTATNYLSPKQLSRLSLDINSYNIQTFSGGHGTITPTNAAAVIGSNVSLTIVPDVEYFLVSLSDNGTDVTASVVNNTYTISKINDFHTIVGTFGKINCVVSGSITGSGTISPVGTTVPYGKSATFTITPDVGYRLGYLLDNGISVTEKISGNSYVIDTVTTDHNLIAAFIDSTMPSVTAQLAAGTSHTVALKSDGTLWAWGRNISGQLGNGTTTDNAVPQYVVVPDATAVTSGALHTLALKVDGTVLAWGSNASGQLGDGTTTIHTTPNPVTGLDGVVSISAGSSHTLAVKKDGTVWAWGSNSSGQLGDGTTTSRKMPTMVPGLTGVVSVAAGQSHSVALKGDGSVVSWGKNSLGQLGDGTTTTHYIPTPVVGLTGIVAIAAGGYHTMALKNDGTPFTWGYNSSGQIGDGTTSNSYFPKAVPWMTGVVKIAAGNEHSIALKSDGTVWAWGYNAKCQLGDGTGTSKLSPIQIPGLAGVVSISAGALHNIAQETAGTLHAWGDNTFGQLGDGTTKNSCSTTQVTGLSFAETTSSFLDYSLSLTSNTIPADYKGAIGIAVNHVTPGTEVLIEQFVDSDQNGIIDADDYVIRSFRINDGTNTGVQQDEDGIVNGSVTTTLNYFLINDLYHAPGKYIFRARNGLFSSSIPFSVTPTSEPTTISGTVTDGMYPVPGAIIRVFDASFRPLASAMSDTVGSYQLKVSRLKGPYYISAYRDGHVMANADQVVNVDLSQEINTNDILLMIGNNRVSGRLIGSDGKGIGGVWLEARTYLWSATITDSDGYYEFYTFQGDFEFPVATDSTVPNLADHGYLMSDIPLYSKQNPLHVLTDTQVPDIFPTPASDSILGRVSDQTDVGTPGILVKAKLIGNDSTQPMSYGVTDANGQFKIGILNYGDWEVTPNGLLAQPSFVGTVIPSYTASSGPVALTAFPITSQFQGTVKSSNSLPIPGVVVKLRNADSTIVTTTKTGNNGSYSLEGYAGNWFIDALTEGLGYADSVEKSIYAGPGVSTVDFVANPLP